MSEILISGIQILLIKFSPCSVCTDYIKSGICREKGIDLSVFMEPITRHYFSFCFLDGERN